MNLLIYLTPKGGEAVQKIELHDYLKQLVDYSNMPLDLSLIVEPFGCYIPAFIFDGVLMGIFLDDIEEQFGSEKSIDIYHVIECLEFYASKDEMENIVKTLINHSHTGVSQSL